MNTIILKIAITVLERDMEDKCSKIGMFSNEQRDISDCANSIVCLRSLNAWRCTNVSISATNLLFVPFLQ